MSAAANGRGRGFTLTEMLVTVAIVSLLATMAVPAYNMVFRFANSTVCGNNLNTLHRGMLMYETDWGKYNMWHKNFNEYSRSHHIFESIWQGHHNGLRPLGYQGLGILVGYNPYWIGSNFYNWPPDYSKSPQAQINAYKSGSGGKSPWKHFRYVADPNTYYCPEMKEGYQSGWYSHLKWTKDWTHWPNGPDNEGYVYGTYTMRPGTRVDWGITDDKGLARSRNVIWPMQEFGVVTPGAIFPGEAVISDANSSKVYVPNCHGTGTNVVYRNGAVHFVEDDGSMTTDNITTFGEGFGKDGATRLVRIWSLYDDRFTP